jgi:hypothetical protein
MSTQRTILTVSYYGSLISITTHSAILQRTPLSIAAAREEIKRSILVWLPQTFTIRGRLRRWFRRLPCIPGQAGQILGPEAILEAPSQGMC